MDSMEDMDMSSKDKNGHFHNDRDSSSPQTTTPATIDLPDISVMTESQLVISNANLVEENGGEFEFEYVAWTGYIDHVDVALFDVDVYLLRRVAIFVDRAGSFFLLSIVFKKDEKIIDWPFFIDFLWFLIFALFPDFCIFFDYYFFFSRFYLAWLRLDENDDVNGQLVSKKSKKQWAKCF